VFSEEKAKELPILPAAEHTIELQEGSRLPTLRGLYPLSLKQEEELRRYLEANLASGRIRTLISPMGAPVLFVSKKDGTLRLCVDYRGLNKITIKNRYPLPLVSELISKLVAVSYISILNIRDAYHRIAIKDLDKWKIAFRIKQGLFEYTVMLFGLTNAPVTFQAYIN